MNETKEMPPRVLKGDISNGDIQTISGNKRLVASDISYFMQKIKKSCTDEGHAIRPLSIAFAPNPNNPDEGLLYGLPNTPEALRDYRQALDKVQHGDNSDFPHANEWIELIKQKFPELTLKIETQRSITIGSNVITPKPVPAPLDYLSRGNWDGSRGL